MDYKNQYNSTNISTQTTTLVATGTGVLHCITFNKPVVAGTVAFYNGIDTNGTLLGTVTTPATPQPFTLRYDIRFGTGLAVVTGGATQNITVVWAQG